MTHHKVHNEEKRRRDPPLSSGNKRTTFGSSKKVWSPPADFKESNLKLETDLRLNGSRRRFFMTRNVLDSNHKRRSRQYLKIPRENKKKRMPLQSQTQRINSRSKLIAWMNLSRALRYKKQKRQIWLSRSRWTSIVSWTGHVQIWFKRNITTKRSLRRALTTLPTSWATTTNLCFWIFELLLT